MKIPGRYVHVLSSLGFLILPLFLMGQTWSGDTLTLHPFRFEDPSPKGWNAQYSAEIDFPNQSNTWSKIIMIQTLKCDSATAGDDYPCGEWDYIWNTLIEIPSADTVEVFNLGSFVTPYGKRLKLGEERGWEWSYDITEYAPLLTGKRKLISGNNQELLDLKFQFIKGVPLRTVISIENIYPYGDYVYEYLATDSLLREREILLDKNASGYRLKAVISGHGHAGPHNCCEWDSKTHSYYLNRWETYRWNVWKDCGNNPIYPQGGTWPFDRAGWCPGTKVDEYEFEITPKVVPGDTILLDYGIENFQDNGEKAGHFRMSHQLFSYGPPNFSSDVVLVDILLPSGKDAYTRANPSCGAPRIKIMNGGKLPLRQLFIEYGIKGTRKLHSKWTGELNFLESAEIDLPPMRMKHLKKQGYFEVSISLGKKMRDDNPANNMLITEFIPPPVLPGEFTLELQTNNLGRARENSFIIQDAEGLTWYYEDKFKDSTTYEFPIALSKGCYQFIFFDDQEDGISLHWWNRNVGTEQVGISGQIKLKTSDGTVLKDFPSDFGQELRFNFMVE